MKRLYKYHHELKGKELISESEYKNYCLDEDATRFSIHWELRSFLYAGVILFCTGLGIFVYNHIDSIGHLAIILLLTSITALCFYFSFKKAIPYSPQKTQNNNVFHDYIVLAANLLLVTLCGYIQFQYSVFGNTGLQFLMPALLSFYCAYRFDHSGVLSIAISSLAIFSGITITPQNLLSANDFTSERTIWTGIGFSLLLVATGYFFHQKKIKTHFSFTYANFIIHLLFICTLAEMFYNTYGWLFIVSIIVQDVFWYRYIMQTKSFMLMLFMVLYSYIAFTYIFIKFFSFFDFNGELLIMLGMIYFTGGSVLLLNFLKNQYVKLRQDAIL